MILEERGVGFLLEKTLLILTDFGDFNKYLKNVGGKKVIGKPMYDACALRIYQQSLL